MERLRSLPMKWACLLLIGGLIQLGVLQFIRTDEPFRSIAFIWSGLFLLMLAGCWIALRIEGALRDRPRQSDDRHPSRSRQRCALIIVIVLMAAAFRLTLVPTWPTLTDDMNRYLWDGRVVLAGENPYAKVPSDPALEALRDDVLYPNLNSPDFHSVYPPLSQGLFAVSVGVADQLWGGDERAAASILKLLLVLFDLAAIVLLIGILTRLKMPIAYAVLYAWNPLPIFEFGASGHSEAPMVFGLTLILWVTLRWRDHRAGVGACAGLTMAVLSKMLPLLLVPLVLTRIGWRYTLLLLAMGIAGGWMLFSPELIRNYLDSVRLYYQYFEFNAGPYLAMKVLGEWITGADVSKQLGPLFGFALLGWTCLVAVTYWKSTRANVHSTDAERSARRLNRAMLAVLGGAIVLSTTVHPWYITWVLPLAIISIAGIGPAWIWLSGAVGWSYLAYTSDPVQMPIWVTPVIWTVFAILLALGFQRHWMAPIMRARAEWKANQIRPYVVGKTLLDVGAGEGDVADALARHTGVRVTLLDTVDFSRHPHQMIVYDGRTIPFGDATFDTVMALTVLHHCEEPSVVLDECIRVSRQRLIVAESVYSTRAGLRLLTFLDRLVNHLRSGGIMERGPLHFQTVEAWREEFQRRGLKITREKWLSQGVHKHILFVLERTDS
ncbi:MAG: class I SAM-dependent methyltransferase [Phycisphaerales bacterium]|nr:MAG: class I SAM-dependent methyltransferase [Phycisphaerales bacterium]